MIRTRNVRRLWNRFSRFFFGAGPWQSPTGKQIMKARNQRAVGLETLEDRVTPASLLYDAAADRLIFLMNSGETITAAASSNAAVSFTSSSGFSNLTVPSAIVSITGSTATFTLVNSLDPVTDISILGSTGTENFSFNTSGSISNYDAPNASITVDPAVEVFTGIQAVTNIGGLTVSSATTYLQNDITTGGNLTFGTRAILNPTSTLTLSYASATFSNGVSGQGTKSLTLNSSGSTNVDASFLNLVNLSVTGGTTNLSGTITTSGTQSYTSPVQLNDNTTLVGTTVTLTGGVNSQATETNNLTITGNAVLGGTFGATRDVGTISVSGTTTLNASANIASVGAQTYTGLVTLAGNATLAGTVAATLTTTAGITGANNNLTLNFPTVSVATGISGVADLNVTGATAINLGDVTTTGTQTYNNTVTLAANTTLQGTTINLGGITGSARNLTITGNPVFGTAVTTGNVAALAVTGNATINAALDVASVSVSGTTAAGANVTTSGTQTYTGAVTLQTANRTFTGSTVTFTGGVVGGSNDLTVTGDAGFGGTTTGVGALTASGTTSLGGSITTTGNQTYTGAVTLSGNSSLTGSGSAALSTPAGITGAGKNLTLNFATVTIASGGSGISGVANLDVTGSNAITLSSVQTTGTQTYNNAVTLSGNTTLNANTGGGSPVSKLITFASTVSGANYDLAISDNAKFQGAVSSVGTFGVSGTTNLGADVTTTGNQTYTGAVTLAASPTVTSSAGNVGFSGTVNGDGVSTTALTVSAAAGTATFGGAVGGSTRIGALSVTGTAIALNANISTANANATFTGPVTLGTANPSVNISTSSDLFAGGNINFTSTVESAAHNGLTVNAGIDASTGGVVTFGGSIGQTDYVGALDATGRIIELHGDVSTGNGMVIFRSPVDLYTNVTIVTSNEIYFNGAVNSFGSLRDLSLNSGNASIYFNGDVGATYSTRLGAFAITSSGTVEVNANFTANSFTATNSTAAFDSSGFTITTSGLADANGGNIAITTTGALTTGDLITSGGSATTGNPGNNAGNVTLISTGGAIVVGAITATGSNAASGAGGDGGVVTLNSDNASTVTLNGSISTAGGTGTTTGGAGQNFSISDSVILGGNVIITTQGSGAGADGTVQFSGAINSSTAKSLTVQADTGTVTLSGAVGTTTRVGALDITGGTIILNNADIKTANANAIFRGAVTLGANVTVDTDTAAGDVQFSSTINGSGNSLTIKAGTGAVTLGGQVGTSVSNRPSSLSINSAGAVTATSADIFAGSVSVGQAGGGLVVASFSSAGKTISTSGATGDAGGNILITTTGAATTGALTTVGGTATGAGKNGGNVALNGSTISVGSIDVSGSNAAVTAAGGNAGTLTFTSVSGITLNGNITAKGGDGAGGGLGNNGGIGSNVTFNQAVTLANSVNINANGGGGTINGGAGEVTFNSNSTVDSTVAGAYGLNISTDNTVTFGAAVGAGTAIGALQVDGSTIALHANITTGNGAFAYFWRDVTLEGVLSSPITITTGNQGINFDRTIKSASHRGLTLNAGNTGDINSIVSFNDEVGGGGNAIGALNVTGTTINIYRNITTSDADATFNGKVVLGADLSITTENATGGAITFNGAVDSDNTAYRDLTLVAGTEAIAFNAAVGLNTRLDVFTITSSGAVDVNANFTANSFTAIAATASFDSAGYTISTSGLAGTVGGNIAITTQAGGALKVGVLNTLGGTVTTGAGKNGGTVNLNTTGVLDITSINTSGSAAFATSGGDGGDAGSVTLSGSTPSSVVLRGDITTRGGNGDGAGNGGAGAGVSFAGPVTLNDATAGDPITINTSSGTGGTPGADGNVAFSSTIDASTAGGSSLTINADGGTVNFGGVVGGTALGTLAVTGSFITLRSATTTETQTYTGAVTLAADTTLTADNAGTNRLVTFTSTVNGGGSNFFNLAIADNAKFQGAVTDLGVLGVTGTSNIGANITTTGTQTYTGAVTLAASTTLTADNAGTNQLITFTSTVAGATFNLSIADNAMFQDAVTDVGTLEVTGTSDIGANITTTGTQTYTGNANLSADVSLATTDSTITFSGTLNNTLTARDLTLATGTGDIAFNGLVGNGTPILDAVIINAARNVTIGASFRANSFNQAVAGTGTFLLTGSIGTTPGGITINSATVTLNNNLVANGPVSVTQTAGTLDVDNYISSIDSETVSLNALDFNIDNGFVLGNNSNVSFNTISGANLSLGAAVSGATITDTELGYISGARAGNHTATFTGQNIYVGGVTGANTTKISLATLTSANNTYFQTNSIFAQDLTVTATAGDIDLGANLTAGGTVSLNATAAGKAILVTANATVTSSSEGIAIDGDVTGTSNSLTLSATNATNGAISIGKTGIGVSAVSVTQLNATAGTTLNLSDATVSTVRAGANGGTVTLSSGGDLTTGSITTSGGSTSTNGYNGGAVSLTSTGAGNISVGAINTSGSAGFSGAYVGGNGGTISFSFTSPASQTITLNGDLNTSGGAATFSVDAGTGAAVTLGRAVVLGGNTTITTTGSTDGAVAFQATLNGRYALNVVAGTAAVGFTGIIGTAVDNANTLSSLTVTSAGAVTFTASAFIAGETQVTGSTSITLAGASYDSTNDGFAFSGPVSLTNAAATNITTGLQAGDDITFSSTLNSVNAAPKNLTLVAGLGGISFGAAVGGTNRFDGFVITSAGAITSQAITANSFTVTQATSFNSTTYGITTLLAGQAGGVVDIHTTGLITTGTVNTAGGSQSSSGADGRNAGNVTLDSSGGVVTVGAVLASGSNSNQGSDGGIGGTVTISGSSILLNGGINAAGGIGDVNGAANGGGISLTGPATLNGTPTSYTLTTGAGTGNISVGAIVGGGKNLKLISGAGTITASGDLTGLGTLTLQDGALFLASAGDATFQGAVNATALVTYDTAYNLSLLGGGTISGNTTLRNTGTLALGDGTGADQLTFTNGLNATAASAITTGGTISTTNKNLNLGDFTTTASTTFGAGTGVITLGAATLGSNTLTLGLGGAGAINLGTVSDGSSTGNLAVNTAGVVTVAGAVDIAGSLNVTGGTGASVNFTRDVATGTLGANAGAYDLLFLENLSTTTGGSATTLGAVSGTVRFGDASDDVTSFAGGLDTTAVTGTLQLAGSVSAASTKVITLGAATLASPLALATSGTGGNLQTGAITSNGNSLMVTAGGTLTLGAIANLTGGLTVTNAGGAASIGELGATSPGNVTITNSAAGVTFSGNVNANTVAVTDTDDTQSITFADGQTVSINTLSLGAQAYNLVVNSGAFTVANAATLGNTGSVTLGNGAADMTTFAGGVTRSSGVTNVAGTLRAVNNNITLPAFNATASATLGAGSGTVTTGRATVTNASSTLTLGQSGSGNINVAGVTGDTGVLADIVFNTLGNIEISGTIDGSVDELAITNVGRAEFDNGVTAASFRQLGGSTEFDSTLALSGALNFKGVALLLDGAVTGATTVDITASTAFNTENAGTINASGAFVQNGVGANYLAGNITAASITFSQPVNLTDGAVTFTTGGAVGNNILINGPLNGNSVITLAAGSGDVTLRSVGNESDIISLGITGANLNLMGLVDVGTFSGTVTGAASVRGIVTGDTGAVSLLAASVNLRSRSIVAGSGGVSVTASSGALTVSSVSPITSGGSISLAAAAGVSLGANLASTNAAIQVTGPLNLTADATVSSGSGNVTFTGNVYGARNLVVASNGLTRFQTTVGATTPLSSLVLDAGGTSRFDANVTTVGALSVGDNLTLGGNVVLATTNSPITVNGTINGLVANSQTLGLTAGTGNIVINGAIGGSTALGAISINSAANLNTGAVTATSFTQSAGTGITNLGGVVSLTGNFAFTGTSLTVTQALTSTGSVSVNNTGLFITDATGDITSTGAFSQTGSGVDSANRLAGNITTTNANISMNSGTTLTGAVAFSTGTGAGDITFNGAVNGGQDMGLTAGTGSISLRSIGNLAPVGTVTVNSAANVTGFSQINAGAFLQLAGTGTTSLRGVSTLSSSGIYIVTGAITLQTRPIYTAAGGTVWLQAQTGALDVRSVSSINASGAVTLSGGTVTLASAITSTNNAVSVTANTLALTGAINSGTAATTITATGAITGSVGTTANVTASSLAMTGSAIGSGTNAIRVKVYTLTTNTSGSNGNQYLAIDSLVDAVVGAADINAGAGTVYLTGGKLVTASGCNVIGSVSIGSGATLTGSGTVSGSVNMVAGGNFFPGSSTSPFVGTISTGAVTMTSGSTFSSFLGAGNACGKVVSSGAVNLGGATLNITGVDSSVAVGNVFTLITGTSLTGEFNGLAEAAIFSAGGKNFRINYTSTSVTLTVVA